MSWLRGTTIPMLTCAALAASVAPARAQNTGDPEKARFQVGSLALSPSIRLTNVGYDSNVFNVSKDANVQSDVTAMFSPVVETWLRTPRVRLSGRSESDFFYYQELTPLRAVDLDHSGRVEFILNRFMPFVGGNLATTRHRQNLEIDAIVQRRNDGLQAGTDIRLTAKASVSVYAERSHLHYQGDPLFEQTDLAHALNHTSTLGGLALRFAATPLTTFAINVEDQRDRFEFSSERSSDSIRISPSVEFKPLAVISGHATMGFRRVKFRQGDQPEFKSTVASVDLQYTLRGHTQIGLRAQRDLEYSYLETQRDYLLAGFGPTVTQRFGDRWDVLGTAGRYRLSYRRRGVDAAGDVPGEVVVSAGLGIGYRLKNTRLGLDVSHYQRDSEVSLGRGYERLRISSSLTYIF